MPRITDEDRKTLEKELEKLERPVTLIFFTQEFECQYCQLTRELLNELVELSDKLALKNYDFVRDKTEADKYGVDKIPAIVLLGEKDYGIRFYGAPAGYEFTTLIEDIIDVSRGTTDLTEGTKEALRKLEKPIHIQVFITLTCPHCPRAVHMAHQMAIESEMVKGDMVEAAEFPQLSNRYFVSAVPKVVINEDVDFEGALPEKSYLDKVMEAEGLARRS
jgi:glutaredoxin-like protein